MITSTVVLWSAIIAVLAVGLLLFVQWLRSRNIEVKWYEWFIGAVGLTLLLFTIQNFVGSFAEFNPVAAWLFLLVTGLPAIILLAVAWQLIARRQSSAG